MTQDAPNKSLSIRASLQDPGGGQDLYKKGSGRGQGQLLLPQQCVPLETAALVHRDPERQLPYTDWPQAVKEFLAEHRLAALLADGAVLLLQLAGYQAQTHTAADVAGIALPVEEAFSLKKKFLHFSLVASGLSCRTPALWLRRMDVVVAHGLSCCAAYGILVSLPGIEPHPLHWKVDSFFFVFVCLFVFLFFFICSEFCHTLK